VIDRMRLLVLDEAAWQTTGGVDTVRRCLLPALARQVDQLWWASPRQASYLRNGEIPELDAIATIDTWPPTRSLGGALWAGTRRMPAAWFVHARAQLAEVISRRHLRTMSRQLGATHVLELCVFRKPYPELDLPTAGIVHDLDYPDRGRSPVDRIFRGWLAGAVCIFADSSQTHAELLEVASNASERIDVVPLPAGSPDTNILLTEISHEVPVLYYPATVLPRKGHDVLFQALALLAEEGVPFHCYLSGAGTDALGQDEPALDPCVEAVRRTCAPWRESLRGRLTCSGYRPWSDVESFYAAADVVVLPSLYEGMGLPLAEAFRRQRPVIASRISPFVDQVEFYRAADQVRWVRPGDAHDLANSLRAILAGSLSFGVFPVPLSERVNEWNWNAYARHLVTALAKHAAVEH
jgi:glycosyltransferase involved in cell wall biosynthesis